jgi:hypothetical protein
MVVNHVQRVVLHKATTLRGAAPVLAYSAFTGAMQTSSDASFLPVRVHLQLHKSGRHPKMPSARYFARVRRFALVKRCCAAPASRPGAMSVM